MKVLGYSQTYRTLCRECSASIFFHTNGDGDAVFFDKLGPPWPIHECYAKFLYERQIIATRISISPGTFMLPDGTATVTVRPDARVEFDARVSQYRPPDLDDEPIVRVTAKAHASRPLPAIQGRVQSIERGVAERMLKRLTGFGHAGLATALGRRRTQVTVVDFEPNSYTGFVDEVALQGAKVGDVVEAVFRVATIPLQDPLFVVDRWRLLIRTRSRVR